MILLQEVSQYPDFHSVAHGDAISFSGYVVCSLYGRERPLVSDVMASNISRV